VASGSKGPQSGGDWLFVCDRSVVIYGSSSVIRKSRICGADGEEQFL
jgi:hypothetical protein